MGRGTVVTLFCALMLAACAAHAEAPALREQRSLNGSWPTGGTVPDYHGTKFTDSRTYQRDVLVPDTWKDKRIKVEFDAVNHKADVYVNDQYVGSHTGGFAPFGFDITSRVTPGSSFSLKVVVTGTNGLKNGSGEFVWPVGGWSDKAGIADDVWLRAYGKVHIQDAYIKTSTASDTITVDYTVTNNDTASRTVTIAGDCVKSGGSSLEKSVSTTVTLAAGETKIVTASAGWSNPTLYWPDRPQLYHLNSRVELNGSVLDRETRRFGFREIEIAGNQFTWNGTRINLYGDYQSFADQWYVDSKTDHSKANWAATIDRMKTLNIRCLRWHHNPVPAYVLDICDEKGLLVCNESPNYARAYLSGTDKTTYISNFKKWCVSWIKADRNRPSVYMFNATNEMTWDDMGNFSGTECRAMGDEMRKYDSTRPIGYDGDVEAAQEAYNYHYPEWYNREPTGSIYSWASKVKSAQPTGSGELLHAKSNDSAVQYTMERNKWWIGIWLRGLRYTNWTDVRPACFWFADDDLRSSDAAVKQRGINLRNAYSPIAVFDKAYDDLGIAPYVNGTTAGGTLPTVTEGSTQNRTLVIYNDEFSNTSLTVECLVRIGSTVYASGTKTFTVNLGQHIDIPVTFQVPYVSSNTTMEWVLRASKNGVQKFEESRRFTVISNGSNGTYNTVVTINGGTQPPPNQAPSVSLSSPASGASFTAPASITVSASASDSDGTVSKVEFYANGSLIGTDTSSSYSVSWNNVAAGTYSLTAKATDNDGATKTSAAVSITVTSTPPPPNQAPSVSLTSPAPGASFTAPAAITVNASASDSDGTVSKVEFYANGSLIGTDSSSSYSISWSNVAAGTYSLTAKATDNDGATKTSAAVSITVASAPPPTQKVVSFTLVNADNDQDIGALNNNATIDLSKTPTRNLNVRANTNPATVGSVRFGFDGDADYHTENGGPYAFAGGTGSDYQAWTPAQGAHTITATPFTAANATGAAGTPLSVNFTVIDPPSITSGPAANGPGVAGQSVSFSVAASDPNGDSLTYSWNFGDGSTGSGAAPQHTYSAPGNYSVTVTVSDGKGGTDSAVTTVTINQAISARINFQLAGTAPTGYAVDSGAVFGNRGNGMSYGWNADNSSTARARGSAASPSVLHDTLLHLQKSENPNASWELAVPNGVYRVRVVAGDPSYFDSTFRINVEGILTVNKTPTSTSRWAEGTQTVSVNDGRLTISNAEGASNNKICFVEINSAAGARSAGSGTDFEALQVLSVKASMSFQKSGIDAVQVKVTLPGLPRDIALAGLTIGVDAGGATESFVLDAKGRGKSGKSTFALKWDNVNSTWSAAISLSKGSWSTVWSDGGISRDTSSAGLDWPVAIVAGDRIFGGSKTVQFKSTGRSGGIK